MILVANGQEIGCGEIKPEGTTYQLVEEDQARIAETLKRQLHVRIMKSKDRKDFKTFGMVFNGLDIELYMMVFDPEDADHYDFYEIDKLKLLSSVYFYNNVEETIENLLSFKVKYSIYIGYKVFNLL